MKKKSKGKLESIANLMNLIKHVWDAVKAGPGGKVIAQKCLFGRRKVSNQ